MAFIDYYKILGVNRNIPQEDVKTAYKRRAKQFHPDLHPDDPKAKAKFQALTEAYEVIGDPAKRAKYDKYGEQWRNAEAYEQAGGFAQGGNGGTRFWGNSQGNDGFNGFDFSSFGNSGSGFSSFFENLFGRKSASNGRAGGFNSNHPNEQHAQVDIDFYTAILGGEVILQLSNGSKIRLKVKPYTQNGTKVRLRNKGGNTNGVSNDLIITYNVKLPTHLTPRQQQLLREMQANEQRTA